MFFVAAEGQSRDGYSQKCLMFRMSNDKTVHKTKRDITKDVAEAIGGIPEESELRAHVVAFDPKSSPSIANGNDHLVFALEDKDDSEDAKRFGIKEKRHCSKIYLVRFCLE